MPSVFQNLETAAAATEAAVESINTKTPALVASDTIPTEFTSAVPVRALPQRQHRLGFSKVIAANAVDTSLLSIISRSAGVGVSQAGGNLTITTGTTANQDLILRGLEPYSGGVRLSCASFLSQRIANQNFIVELVDILGDGLAATIVGATSMTVTLPTIPDAMSVGQGFTVGGYVGTGVLPSQRATISAIAGTVVTLTIAGGTAGTGTVSAFGWNYYQVLYNGTTATAAIYNNQRNGWKDTDTTLTINTTASPGHAVIVSANDARVRVSDQVLTSATAPNITDRASRAVNVPDDIPLYLQVRVVNGTSNPASTTTWSINSITVGNFAGQDVVIQDQRQAPSMHKMDVVLAAGANAIGSVTASGTVTANQGTAAASAWLANPLTPAVSLTGDTGAKTATPFNGATQTNATAKGELVVVNLGAITLGTGGTATFKIQGSADSGTTWVDIPGATTAALTLTGAYGIQVYPGITPVAGASTAGTVAAVSAALPRTWRIVGTFAGSGYSFTVTNVQVSYLI